ncbi:MAG: hypothetical protein ACLFSQ_13245 [Candidatus Zixiibacteriota bacterium]
MKNYFKRLKNIDIENIEKELKDIGKDMRDRTSDEVLKKLEKVKDITKYEDYEKMLDEYSESANISTLEDFYNYAQKCKNLIESAPKIKQMREYLEKMPLPAYQKELEFQRDVLLSKLTQEALIEGSLNLDVISMEFENLRADYAKFYAMEHNKFQQQLADIVNRIGEVERKLTAIEYLSEIDELKIAASKLSKEFNKLQPRLKKCEPITEQQLWEYINPWHNCNFKPSEPDAIESFLKLEDVVNAQYKKTSDKLSNILAQKILARKERESVNKLVDALQVADIDKIDRIISDDLIKTLRDIIRED